MLAGSKCFTFSQVMTRILAPPPRMFSSRRSRRCFCSPRTSLWDSRGTYSREFGRVPVASYFDVDWQKFSNMHFPARSKVRVKFLLRRRGRRRRRPSDGDSRAKNDRLNLSSTTVAGISTRKSSASSWRLMSAAQSCRSGEKRRRKRECTAIITHAVMTTIYKNSLQDYPLAPPLRFSFDISSPRDALRPCVSPFLLPRSLFSASRSMKLHHVTTEAMKAFK